MIYGPRILNLRLCFMKDHVIRYTRSNFIDFRSNLLISDSDFEISNVNE